MNSRACHSMKKSPRPCFFPLFIAVLLLLPALPPPAAHAAGGIWLPAGAMKDGRYNHTATLLPDGTVLVAGGQRDSEDLPDCLSGCELYDPSTGTWRTVSGLASVRSSHTATLLRDGRVLVTGGQDRKREVGTSEIYDPVAGTWEPAETMHQRRLGHTATLLGDGRVLVTGGVDVQWEPLAGTEIFDPDRGTWAAAGEMAHPRGWHRATLLPDGRVFVFGGWDGRRPQETAEIFDPLTGGWHEASPLEGRPLYFASQILLSGEDGRVLVAGGYGNGLTWKDVHFYDPGTDAWTSGISEMFEERNAHTATLLPDGRVLIAGGCCVSGCRNSEVFDPATGIFSRPGPMVRPSGHHTATLLPDGTVLVAGGRSDFEPLNRAEIHDPGRHPVPVLAEIDPSSAPAGSPAIDLTVSGSDFTESSIVRWNGLDRDTTCVSPTELRAALPAADLAEAGMAEVMVFTPSPGGGCSGGAVFTIVKKVERTPEIKELKPSRVRAGDPGFTLRVWGGHFMIGSRILWNGREIRTIFLNSRMLAAYVHSREIAHPGMVKVQVSDARTGRGLSNTVLLPIDERTTGSAVEAGL